MNNYNNSSVSQSDRSNFSLSSSNSYSYSLPSSHSSVSNHQSPNTSSNSHNYQSSFTSSVHSNINSQSHSRSRSRSKLSNKRDSPHSNIKSYTNTSNTQNRRVFITNSKQRHIIPGNRQVIYQRQHKYQSPESQQTSSHSPFTIPSVSHHTSHETRTEDIRDRWMTDTHSSKHRKKQMIKRYEIKEKHEQNKKNIRNTKNKKNRSTLKTKKRNNDSKYIRKRKTKNDKKPKKYKKNDKNIKSKKKHRKQKKRKRKMNDDQNKKSSRVNKDRYSSELRKKKRYHRKKYQSPSLSRKRKQSPVNKEYDRSVHHRQHSHRYSCNFGRKSSKNERIHRSSHSRYYSKKNRSRSRRRSHSNRDLSSEESEIQSNESHSNSLSKQSNFSGEKNETDIHSNVQNSASKLKMMKSKESSVSSSSSVVIADEECKNSKETLVLDKVHTLQPSKYAPTFIPSSLPQSFISKSKPAPKVKPLSRRHKLAAVEAAVATIAQKHENDDKHPLDIAQRNLSSDPRVMDNAKIWAAITGHFEVDILQWPSFQKAILKALNTTNDKFDIGLFFTQFSGLSGTLTWLDKSNSKGSDGIRKSELMTFKDLIGIRSFRQELNHCNGLWKFLFYQHSHLFWSMAVFYGLLKSTGVEQWDVMWNEQKKLITEFGAEKYIFEYENIVHCDGEKNKKESASSNT